MSIFAQLCYVSTPAFDIIILFPAKIDYLFSISMSIPISGSCLKTEKNADAIFFLDNYKCTLLFRKLPRHKTPSDLVLTLLITRVPFAQYLIPAVEASTLVHCSRPRGTDPLYLSLVPFTGVRSLWFFLPVKGAPS